MKGEREGGKEQRVCVCVCVCVCVFVCVRGCSCVIIYILHVSMRG